MDRIKRLQSIIYKNLTEIITYELTNENIGLVSISEVILSRDYSHAKIYVTFLGAQNPSDNIKELNKAKGYIRHSLSEKMDTRKVPEITFILDESYEKEKRIDELLSKEKDQLDSFKK